MRFVFVVAIAALLLCVAASPESVYASSINLTGSVTNIVSNSEFIYKTSTNGYVPVIYSETMVIPANARIVVGQNVTVQGVFDRYRRLVATRVSTVSSGPGHIANWVNDLYGGEGASATAAQVTQFATFAESGLGNSKASDDCRSRPGTCRSVYYMDQNKAYFSVKCPYSVDAAFLLQAKESWFVHQPGYTDALHRVYGIYRQSCLGTTISIPIWAPNDANASVQAWWRSELQTNADNYDVMFMDDTHASVVDQYYFYGSGGGCLPWPTFCTSTQEVRSNVAVQAGHASFANALIHRNGRHMQLAFNSMNFDGQPVSDGVSLFRASPNIIAGVCEGCAVSNGHLLTSNYYRILNTMAATNRTQGTVVLHSTDSAPSGSSTQILERSITTGLVWLGYSEGHTVAWPDLEDTTTRLAVWPENLIYPSGARQSMNSGATDLQVASGVWRREFSTCYNGGTLFGQCAAIVNSTSGYVRIQSSWLSQNYGHIIALYGGDVLSGGSLSLTSQRFYANSSAVPPGGSVLLSP